MKDADDDPVFKARYKSGTTTYFSGERRSSKELATKDLLHYFVTSDTNFIAALAYYRDALKDKVTMPDLDHILRWYPIPPSTMLAGSICDVLDHSGQVKIYPHFGFAAKHCEACGIELQRNKTVFSCVVCHKAKRNLSASTVFAFCSLCAPDIRAKNARLLKIRDSMLTTLA